MRILNLILCGCTLAALPTVSYGEWLIGGMATGIRYASVGTRSDIWGGTGTVEYRLFNGPVSLTSFGEAGLLKPPQEITVAKGGELFDAVDESNRSVTNWGSVSPRTYRRVGLGILTGGGIGTTVRLWKDAEGGDRLTLTPYVGFGWTWFKSPRKSGGGSTGASYIIESRVPEVSEKGETSFSFNQQATQLDPVIEFCGKNIDGLDPCDLRRKTTYSLGIAVDNRIGAGEWFLRFKPEMFETSFGESIQKNFRLSVGFMRRLGR